MLAKDIKRGSVVVYSGAPCMIETVTVQTPSARGASTFYKYRGRNLVAKQKVDITLRGGESLDEADFQRCEGQVPVLDPTTHFFMDQKDYNQYEIAKEDVGEEFGYITEELEGLLALIYNDAMIGIQLPAAVALKITQTDPAIKGGFCHRTDLNRPRSKRA